MILTDMYNAVKTVFGHLYNELFAKNERNASYLKNVLIAALIVGIAAAGFYGYKFYMHSKESSAQKVFSECMNEFDNAREGTGSWSNVEEAFDLGYKQNSGSSLAPYFLALKAESLYEQGKTKESMDVLSSALNKMSQKDDFYGMYKAKLGLAKMDSKDVAVHKEGFDILKSLSENVNSGQSTALYYLGLHFWDKNDMQKAKGYWNKLVSSFEQEQKKASSKLPLKETPYVKMAQEKLAQLD
ncbi:hypothetical protein ACFLYU_00640 [Candidatus Dependentiae bacterium]